MLYIIQKLFLHTDSTIQNITFEAEEMLHQNTTESVVTRLQPNLVTVKLSKWVHLTRRLGMI